MSAAEQLAIYAATPERDMAARILREMGVELLGSGYEDWPLLLVALDCLGGSKDLRQLRLPQGLYVSRVPARLSKVAPNRVAIVSLHDCVRWRTMSAAHRLGWSWAPHVWPPCQDQRGRWRWPRHHVDGNSMPPYLAALGYLRGRVALRTDTECVGAIDCWAVRLGLANAIREAVRAHLEAMALGDAEAV